METEKPKINWLQVAAIVIPLIIAGATGWFSMGVRVARMEERMSDGRMDRLEQEVLRQKEKQDEKNSKMWQAISNKQDK